MRRRVLGVALATMGCGDQASPAVGSAVASTGGSGEVHLETAADDDRFDDLPWEPLADLPPQNKSCEERGARFGIVAGPAEIDTQSPVSAIDDIGLSVGAQGLFVTYTRPNSETGSTDVIGLRVAFDGRPKGTPWALPISAPTAAAHGRDGGVLMTYCVGGQVGWRVFDVGGEARGTELHSGSYASCDGQPPAAAWTRLGYLAAWHVDPSEQCLDGCLALAFGREDVVFRTDLLRPAFVVREPLTIASTDEAALVVASHVSVDGTNELAMSLVEPGGKPLFPPLHYAFASATSPGPQAHAPVAAIARDDEGYSVFVGGRGAAFGRVHLDAIATVTHDYDDVPLPDTTAEFDAFRDSIDVAVRTGGFVLYGPATRRAGDSEVTGTLFVMLDQTGEPTTQEFYGGAADGAVVSRGEQTWLVYGGASVGLRVAELGCVF